MRQGRTIVLGATIVAATLVIGSAVAEAQTRPPNRNASSTGGSSGTRGGSELPTEVTGHRSRSSAPQVDIIDLRDRTDGSRDVAAAETSTQPGVITCEAGCDGPPGKVVYAALIAPPATAAQGALIAASLTNAPDVPSQPSSNANTVLCIAGCFDEPAWRDPRVKSRTQPSTQPPVIVASLSPPVAAVSLPLRPNVATVKPSTAQKRAPAVHVAALAPRRHFAPAAVTSAKVETAPVRVVHKRKSIKRFAVKAKRSVVMHRTVRHKIIRPAAKYPPRPLPQPVRTAEVTAARKHAPLSPGAVAAANVTLAEARKPELATVSAVELARRATRDPVLRQKLASSSSDWLNKGKRDAEPSSRVH